MSSKVSLLSSTNVLVHTPTPKSFKPHARVPARPHTSLSAMKSRGKTWSTHLGATRLVQTVKDCHATVKATPGQALVPQASPVQASSSSKQYQDGPSNSVSGLSPPSSSQPAECSFGSSSAAGGARPSLPFILPPEISTSEHIRPSRCVLVNQPAHLLLSAPADVTGCFNATHAAQARHVHACVRAAQKAAGTQRKGIGLGKGWPAARHGCCKWLWRRRSPSAVSCWRDL